MPSYRIGRLTHDIERELAVIQRKIKDPRITDSMVSIVKLDLSNDMSHCKIYISSLKGLSVAKKAVEGYKSAEGFIKKELSNSIKMRQIPKLHFVATDSIEYSEKISKKLDEMK